MKFAILGILLGTLIGFVIPVTYSSAYAVYMSMVILVCLDTVLGGVKANLKGEFDTKLFLSGLAVQSIAAIFLTYIGEVLGVPVYYSGIVFFGSRIFKSISSIRRLFIQDRQ